MPARAPKSVIILTPPRPGSVTDLLRSRNILLLNQNHFLSEYLQDTAGSFLSPISTAVPYLSVFR